MIEHNAANRQQLERLPVDYHVPTTPGRPPGAKDPSSSQGGPEGEVKGDESSQESGCGLLRGRNTCIKALISLFLKHYHNAEGATIEVRVQTVSIYTYYYTTVHYGGVILVYNGHCQCLECSSQKFSDTIGQFMDSKSRSSPEWMDSESTLQGTMVHHICFGFWRCERTLVFREVLQSRGVAGSCACGAL